MLNTIKQFFEDSLSPVSQDDTEHRLKLATAALFIEMMQQDGHRKSEEEMAVKNLLQDRFGLAENETHTLFELAHEEARQAVDFFQFTNLIHQHFSPQQKIQVLEYLWMIAYADNHLDAHEEHLVRRIADLLYVPHRDFIRAKHAALEKYNA